MEYASNLVFIMNVPTSAIEQPPTIQDKRRGFFILTVEKKKKTYTTATHGWLNRKLLAFRRSYLHFRSIGEDQTTYNYSNTCQYETVLSTHILDCKSVTNVNKQADEVPPRNGSVFSMEVEVPLLLGIAIMWALMGIKGIG